MQMRNLNQSNFLSRVTQQNGVAALAAVDDLPP